MKDLTVAFLGFYAKISLPNTGDYFEESIEETRLDYGRSA